MIRHHLLYSVFLFIPLFFFSCGRDRSAAEEDGMNISVSAPLVESYECTRQEYSRSIETFGTIRYVKKTEIYPMASEIIRHMYFEEGDTVSAGSVLAELDCRKLDIQIREARAGLLIKETEWNLALQQWEEGKRDMEARFLEIESARLDLQKAAMDRDRLKRILENKKQIFELDGISQEDLESIEMESQQKQFAFRKAQSTLTVKMIGFRDEDLLAAGYAIPQDEKEMKKLFIDYNTRMLQARVDVAAAELEAARSRMESLSLYREESIIHSPVSGIIGKKYMEEGEKASEDKPLYLIFPEKSVYAEARVSEKELVILSPGMEGTVFPDTTRQNRTGQIQKMSPWVEENSRTGSINILLDNRDGLFRIGQYVRIRVSLSAPGLSLMIPEEAVVNEEGEDSAFLIRENRIFKKSLSLEREVNGMVPVISGLDEGDLVVLNPREGFRNGMEVDVR